MKNENTTSLKGAISFWQTKESELKEVFRPDIDKERYFLEEKLRYFSDIREKHKGNLSESDKISFNVLNGEIKKLERYLYPNLLQRVVARIGRSIEKFVQDRKAVNQRNRNNIIPLNFSLKANPKQVNSVAKKATQQLNPDTQQQAAKGQEQKQQANSITLQPPKQSLGENHLRKALNGNKPNLKVGNTTQKRAHRHRLH